MAPKKGKKISLNEFLGDNTFGSWADEMEALPTAPAARMDDHQSRGHDRLSKREDAIRVDHPSLPREDVSLPTRPPYTAFVGNLAFDLTDLDLQNFFSDFGVKSVKIIRDREDKPKGFGYVEFDGLDGLKDALARTGSNLSGRIVRVSVAEPPKERSNPPLVEDRFKSEGPWRREGPLPDIPEREHSRRRFDGPPQDQMAISDASPDWRSSRPRISESETLPFKRKGSDFPTGSHPTPADKEVWTIGSKFKPFDDAPGTRSAVTRGKYDTKDEATDEPDWRSSARPRAAGRNDASPVASTPSTPQIGRRKLELLPRSGNVSSSPSPVSSPKMSPASSTTARPNPFGSAKPVDVSKRDKEVSDRLERDREAVKERLSMSRTSSHGGSERALQNTAKANPPQNISSTQRVPSTASVSASNIRPTLSFANAAANKGSATKTTETQEGVGEYTTEEPNYNTI